MIHKKPNELEIIRMYDAPIKSVWDAWTDPEQVARWWGPRGFTITTHSKDLRTGGSWIYTMHGPDGVDYPNSTAYLEVEPMTRLVYDHGANDDQPALFRVVVNFEEIGEKTKMEMRMILSTPEKAKEIAKFVKAAGGNATWDRLAEFLDKQTSEQEVFVINRTFLAPIDRMFDMWTNPTHSAQWSPPTGFTMNFIKADIREGGSSFYSMTDGGNVTMYGKVKYLELRRPDRFVYTQQFCDANENISRHPFAPTWPETMLTTVTFAQEGPEHTRVTVKWEVYGDATAAEIETFAGAKTGMTQGWTGSFDKLDIYLNNM